MTSSEQTNELDAAMAKAQGEMKSPPLNKVNPHFKNKYSDLAAIREATIPALSKNGLSIKQFTRMIGEGLFLVTRIGHSSGQWEEGEYPLPMALDKPQVMGSALTYARRYCWSAACAIVGDEDDDANAAQNNGAKAKPAEKPAWRGPMKVTELKAAMRALSERMTGGSLGTTGDLEAVKEEYAAVIEQARHDLPDWHEGYDQTAKRLQTTLMVGPASADPDDPSTYEAAQ